MIQTAYTVQVNFFPSGNEDQAPRQSDVYIDFPLGTPLPHTGDKIMLDDTPYKVIDRALIISDDVIRDASWSLSIVKMNP